MDFRKLRYYLYKRKDIKVLSWSEWKLQSWLFFVLFCLFSQNWMLPCCKKRKEETSFSSHLTGARVQQRDGFTWTNQTEAFCASKIKMEIITMPLNTLHFECKLFRAGREIYIYIFLFYHLQLGLELQGCTSQLMSIRKTLSREILPLFSLGTSQIKSTVSAG